MKHKVLYLAKSVWQFCKEHSNISCLNAISSSSSSFLNVLPLHSHPPYSLLSASHLFYSPTSLFTLLNEEHPTRCSSKNVFLLKKLSNYKLSKVQSSYKNLRNTFNISLIYTNSFENLIFNWFKTV